MTTDFRALCAELVDYWENDCPVTLAEVMERARAALAEPEPEWPTDEEIMGLMPQQMRDDLAAAARALAGFDPDNIKVASVFRIILNRHSVDHARAVLARWGTPNSAETRRSLREPADGEVAELVAWLRGANWDRQRQTLATRAAELLERLSTTQKELERERLRLAACGAVAMADTPETAAKTRDCLPEYWSASADDIARQIDKLMRLSPPQPS